MEPKGLVPCSQEPFTGPYPELDQSSPYNPILSLQDPFSFASVVLAKESVQVRGFLNIFVRSLFFTVRSC
jgi:hypothetical protein